MLAKTGATKFLYLPFTGYKGHDSYAIKVCAIVQGRSGCSSLTYVVDVRYEPFDIIKGAQPPLRPLHLVVRETEFCGQRLAGDFSRRMRENGRNSVRRPRHASLTDRNCVQGRSGCSSLTYVVDVRYEPFDIIEGAQPPLRPLHLVVRETEFCGQRLACRASGTLGPHPLGDPKFRPRGVLRRTDTPL